MLFSRWLCFCFFAFVTGLQAQDIPAPGVVAVKMDGSGASPVLVVDVQVATGCYFYADHYRVEGLAGGVLKEMARPQSEVIYDQFSEQDKAVYRHSFRDSYAVSGFTGGWLKVAVYLQGCNDSTCFLPQEATWLVSPTGSHEIASSLTASEVSDQAEWRALAGKFTEVRRASGYMGATEFSSFLRGEELAVDGGGGMWLGLEKASGVLAVGLILLGGLLLNLTPCVLPMIPVNLAIIGAGAGTTWRRGFALGGLYGLAMALTYGVLGLVVVLTGATFGAWQSSPWFNLAIAVIFVVLALALFDLILIDFARFNFAVSPRRGLLFVLFMGTTAALLAGACVAPVVISVLLWSSTLYNSGATIGLLLPFILGVGMGLPWPLLGAGLALLPKPGRWMVGIKYGFGVIILILAGYYGFLAYHAWQSEDSQRVNARFAKDLGAALAAGKPVLLDFWAESCKSCLVMEKMVMTQPNVQQALSGFYVVKYSAERAQDPAVKAVLDYYQVLGLPTFVVLKNRP